MACPVPCRRRLAIWACCVSQTLGLIFYLIGRLPGSRGCSVRSEEPDFVLSESEGRCDFLCRGQQGVCGRGCWLQARDQEERDKEGG